MEVYLRKRRNQILTAPFIPVEVSLENVESSMRVIAGYIRSCKKESRRDGLKSILLTLDKERERIEMSLKTKQFEEEKIEKLLLIY